MVRDNFAKAHKAVQRERRSRYPHLPLVAPKHDDVVAKTEFSTWEFLLDQEFMGAGLFWPTKLGQVLKGTWPSTKARVSLAHAQNLVKTARELRNRVSHHEPVWKRFGVMNEVDAVAHLQEKLDTIEAAIALFSPGKLLFVQKNRILRNARRICSLEELMRFKKDGPVIAVQSMSRLKSILSDPRNQGQAIAIRLYAPDRRRYLVYSEGR